MDRFERTLARQDSATAALGDWCRSRGIANPPMIRALRLAGEEGAASPDVRQALAVPDSEAIAYRHVRLTCGDQVLSEAHNWYVAERLTPTMNATLASSDTPFGKVVLPLRFSRQRLAARRGPLPGCPRGTILAHRAMLVLPDGRPLALLLECYTRANLAGRSR